MKKSLLSVLLVTGVAGAAIAQQAVTPAAPPATAHTAADQMKGAAPAQAAFTPPVPPPRKLAPPVPALLQSRAHEVWTTNCVACHGNTIEPGAKAKSLFSEPFLNSRTDAQIVQTTANGPQGVANHGFKTLYLPEEINQIPAYLRIRGGVMNRKIGDTPDPHGKVFKSQKANFKVEVLAKGFNQPWGLEFLPDGRMIFTERSGAVRFLDKSGKVSAPVKGTPKVFERQDGGMLDVALDPDFSKNGWIYLAYSDVPPNFTHEPGTEKAPLMAPPTMTYIVRGKVNANNEWTEQQMLFKAAYDLFTFPADHYGARFLFDDKGHMFWTMGERHDMQASQNLASPLGKIHRIHLDGSIPKDNPFVNTPGALGSIWSYGHRNPEGIDFDPVTGLLWETEHGPVGGDEINIVEPGKNYGWGVVTYGLEPGILRQEAVGMVPPVTYYNPSIGPGGTAFYTGDRIPAWKNNMFIAGMVGQRLIRLEIKDRQIVSQEIVFRDHGRIREVITGPDGYLYLLLQNRNGDPVGGSIARLVPAK